ncbi:MAG: hypothetical protein HS100_18905 [Anaerolineales bacterium]|nr:hypothetical protein [Anaerolineales bacterium]
MDNDQIAILLASFLVFNFLGLLINNWLQKSGVVRDSKKIIFLGVSSLVLLKPFVAPDVSWWIFGLIILLSILAGLRNDIRETLKHGTWWWLKKDKKQVKRSSKNTS